MISIIIPVYNAEKYLDECLCSISDQVYKDYEVLMINDGSNDGSCNICQKYSETDSRFKYFYQDNHGASYARNVGLKIAQGEYIAFVDADDKIDEYFLDHLISAINEEAADIAVCDFYNESGREHPSWERNVFVGNEILSAYLRGSFTNRIMNKLYRKKIIYDLFFPDGRNIMEDAYWTTNVLCRCHLIVQTSHAEYYYRVLSGSLSHRKFSEVEEVGCFRNQLDKLVICMSSELDDNAQRIAKDSLIKLIAAMLKSFDNLSLFDTFLYLKAFLINQDRKLNSNIEVSCIKENDHPYQAQKAYLKYIIMHNRGTVIDRVKAIRRFLLVNYNGRRNS